MQMAGGLTICAITAALGALAWFGLVVASGREFPLFAWLIGICCGTGMFLGIRRRSFSGGVIAATLTAAAIFAARWLIFQNILVPAIQSPTVAQADLPPLVQSLMPPPAQAAGANIAEQIQAEWQRQITVTQTGTSQPTTDAAAAVPATQTTAPPVLAASLFWAAMFSTGTWFRLALSCLSAFAIVGVFARG